MKNIAGETVPPAFIPLQPTLNKISVINAIISDRYFAKFILLNITANFHSATYILCDIVEHNSLCAGDLIRINLGL